MKKGKKEKDIPEVPFDVNASLGSVPPKKTTNRMTLYEFSALVTAQAIKIAGGIIEPEKQDMQNTIIFKDGKIENLQVDEKLDLDYNAINIAYRQIISGNNHLIVRRKFPDGTFEDWHVTEMILPNL